MKKIALLIPVLTLAACGQEPAPEPAPTQTPTAPMTPSMPAPDKAILSEVLADACPELEPVNTAMCKRAGLGSTDVICEYGLGDDEYLRDKATLSATDGEWVLADSETVCAQ